jgi:hypothetical protein
MITIQQTTYAAVKPGMHLFDGSEVVARERTGRLTSLCIINRAGYPLFITRPSSLHLFVQSPVNA